MFKKSLAAIAVLLTAAQAKLNQDFAVHLRGEAPIDDVVFEQIWVQYNQEYDSPARGVKSEAARMSDLHAAVDSVVAHNSDPAHSYKAGLNAYSDMTDAEFAAHFRLQQVQEDQHCSATKDRQGVEQLGAIPENWDWRDHDGVSPVKNQGHCGSCWTFSTVGTLEAHSLLKYKEFDSLAEQQLVDCAGAYDNHGCQGGLPSHAFEYIAAAGGISTEVAYPYKAVDQNCTVKPATFALQVIGGSVNITEGDEDALRVAVFQHGPVSIAFQVVDGFRDYTSGVYSSTVCKNSTNDVNHAVVVVGFGVEDGIEYWLVKNSWGADWGDQGFFKIQRGVNMCGVAVCNSYPQDVARIGSSSAPFLQ